MNILARIARQLEEDGAYPEGDLFDEYGQPTATAPRSQQQPEEITPNNILARYLEESLSPGEAPMPSPRYDVAPMAMNTMRFENGPRAGDVVPLGPQSRRAGAPPSSVAAGYPDQVSRAADRGADRGADTWWDQFESEFAPKLGAPVEMAGKGMGRYSADGRSIVFPDGSTHDLHPERTQQDLARWFANAKAKQGLVKGEVDIAADQERIATSRAARMQREDPTTQTALEKRFGKAEKGMQWNAEGTLVPIPGGHKLQDAKDVLSILNLAEPLIDQATGSYAGAGTDELGRFMGWSSPSANAAAQLKALQGALIAKMPRMEGPQSDADRRLYEANAGRIGDSTIPPDQKREALNMIRQLQQQYASAGAPRQAAAAPAGDRSSGPQPMPAREQLVPGQLYQTKRGPARWNGRAFEGA